MSYPFCAFAVVNQPVADPGEAGGSPPLFRDETEVQRDEKIIFGDHPALSKGMDDCPPPLISRSGSGTFSGVLATLVVPSKGRPPLNTLGTGHYSSLEGGGGGGGGGGGFWAKQGEI